MAMRRAWNCLRFTHRRSPSFSARVACQLVEPSAEREIQHSRWSFERAFDTSSGSHHPRGLEPLGIAEPSRGLCSHLSPDLGRVGPSGNLEGPLGSSDGSVPAQAVRSSEETSVSSHVSVDSVYVSSPRHDMAMIFTCTVCETRSAKTMSRSSYETGIVIVRCGGCKNLHLIADRYGWFGEKGGVEDFLAGKGVDVRTGTDSTYEFTMEDLAGWSGQDKDNGAK